MKLKKIIFTFLILFIFSLMTSLNVYALNYNVFIYEIIDNEITITNCYNEFDSIPVEIEGYPVTKIAKGAFYYIPSDKNVTIPYAVREIGDYAFLGENGYKIKDITVPKKVEKIGKYAIGYEIVHVVEDYTPKEKIKKIDGMIIRGYKGTVAETYAKENGFTFIAIDESEVTTTVTTAVSTTTETTVSTTATTPIETTVSTTTSTEITTTPTVTTATTTTSAVSNTTATETTSITTTDTTTITTTTTEPIKIAGDANGDNTLDVRDCAYIASMLAKGKKEEIPENANFNDDEIIDVRDAAAIAYYLANRYV